jgi:hypothetical protein
MNQKAVSGAVAHGPYIAFRRNQPGDTPAVSMITRISRMRITAAAGAWIIVPRSLTIVGSLAQFICRPFCRHQKSYHAMMVDVNRSEGGFLERIEQITGKSAP